MALITWDDSIQFGLWTIDTQHQRWVGFINDLHEAMLVGRGNAIVGLTLAAMLDYTRTHFADEETLLRGLEYPGYAKHKALHDALIAKVLNLQQKRETSLTPITLEVMNSLKDWLLDHIKTVDREYVPFLQSKGVS